MTFEKTDTTKLGIVDYRYNEDHELIAQHNYDYGTRKEFSFRGWYDPAMMNGCTSIIAIWRIKERH
jgi:hypothetical protein